MVGQLAAIVEYSNDAIYSRTFDGTITTWNAAATRIFGYSAEEIVGQTSRRLLPPGKQEELRRLVRRLRGGKIVEHFETERLRKDGSRIQVSLTLSPIRDSSRRLIGFSTVARDISEQSRVRETLARREQELNDLFEQASVGLVLVRPDGRVLRANRAFLSLLDRPSHQVNGAPLGTFHPTPQVVEEMFARLESRETIQSFPTEFLNAKGETRFVIVDADGFWEKGHWMHTRWFVRDISRRRQLERELLENSDRERRIFAHELHDGLGQQLGGVAYLCNVLRESLTQRGAPEAGSATRIFELLRKAIEDTRRMARGLSPIPEEPEGLMDALRELAARTSELQGIRCKVGSRKPVLVSDTAMASHLYRIAQEAVHNAVKHARPRTISILLRLSQGRLILAILDDGHGIAPLSPNRKGLGLRIMQYRTGLMGGTITIVPRPLRGTEVRCTVPITSQTSSPPSVSSLSTL